MAAPFNGEEYYAKRSFFSSILGLKFGRQSRSNASSVPSQSHIPRQLEPQQLPPPEQYLGIDQPCSSRTILVESPQTSIPMANSQSQYLLGDGDFEGRDRSLSDQLADTLMVTSHHTSPEPQQSMLSPQDIYQEIVCECAHFDQQTTETHQLHHQHHHYHYQQQHSNQPSSQQIGGNSYYPQQAMQPQLILPQSTPIQSYYHYPSPSMQYPTPRETTANSPSYCVNCRNCQSITSIMDESTLKATVIEELANKTSLEDLVKLVVAAVKDAGGIGKTDKRQESPEEILKRKRQQNNEAAARYRKRQREAKMNANGELEQLTSRNLELNAELTTLQDQINNLKNKITSSRPLTSSLPKS